MKLALLFALLTTVPDPPAPPKPAATVDPAPKPEAPNGPPTAKYQVHGGNVFVVGLPLVANGRKNHAGLIDALTVALAVAVVEREQEDARIVRALALESKAAEDAQKPVPPAKPAKVKK